ncbi:MAG: glycosyltransferase [Acidimicrobiales bacterium]
MDSQPSAPPVVAVVVASEQGDWFEEALAALGHQDYPNQSVLVIDAGNAGDPAPRVAAVLPDAYLRRASDAGGFARLANDALETVQGSAFLLFCHDDVALAPNAVRLLVEEALRSNAGIAGPKLVGWDDPTGLLDVGLSVDKTAATRSLVDRGEIDQEQHDAVRDVFAVPTAAMLVRSDLFFALGGFDPTMQDHGADVDLCWRAQVAGARVMVVPAAVARHREGGSEGVRDDPRAVPALARNHLRTMLKSYSLAHLLRVLPQAAIVTVVEVTIALAHGRWSEARGLVTAWPSNFGRLSDIRRARRRVRASRAVPDSEVRRLQVRGSVRVSAYVRRRLQPEDRARALVSAGQELMGRVGKGPAQAATGLLVLLCLGFVVGSRHLLGGRIPAVGQFAPLPGATTLLSHFVHGWRTTGMGSAASSPPSFGLLGIGGLVLAGRVAMLQKLLVLATWPVATVGAWRLGRVLRSGLGRMVMVVAYLAVPLSYDSLARGHWDGLIAYAAVPFLLSRLARLGGLTPFEADGGDPVGPQRRRLEVLGLALGTAAVAGLVPAIAVAVLLTAIGLVLGSLAAGEVEGAVRALGGALVAVLGAALLLVPWSADQLGGGWASLVGPAPPTGRAFGLGALLRFQVGPIGAGFLGWALVVAAVLPLVLGHGWRLGWAVRCWAVVLVSVGTAWAAGRGWLPFRPQAPDVLLAPAAVALALAAALGAAAFESDLPRYRFGWRQIASVVAGAAVTLSTLPILVAARDGAWRLPSPELAHSLTYMAQKANEGSFRVLWLGDPEVLPLGSWGMGGGVAYATSRDGMPAATDVLPGLPSGATKAVVAALGQAERGDTSRLGQLLAPMAVRYLVLPSQIAAGNPAGPQRPPPTGLSASLQSQLDLRLLPSDPAAVVYENTAWGPARQEVGPVGPGDRASPITAEAPPATLGKGADLSGGAPVLPGRGPVSFAGELSGGRRVIVSETPSARWKLQVGGHQAPRQTAFGVANAYAPDGGGRATLRYRTPLARYAALALGIALWVFAVRALFQLRRRLGAPVAAPPVGAASRPPETAAMAP